MNERIYEAREAAEVRDPLTKVRNGGIGVVDLPDFIIVVEFDFAPMCLALVA
jgi:hypothetical protein